MVKVREGPQTKAFKKVVGDMFTQVCCALFARLSRPCVCLTCSAFCDSLHECYQVDAVKPHASRPESAEHYLIGMHFNGAHVKRMSEPLE